MNVNQAIRVITVHKITAGSCKDTKMVKKEWDTTEKWQGIAFKILDKPQETFFFLQLKKSSPLRENPVRRPETFFENVSFRCHSGFGLPESIQTIIWHEQIVLVNSGKVASQYIQKLLKYQKVATKIYFYLFIYCNLSQQIFRKVACVATSIEVKDTIFFIFSG